MIIPIEKHKQPTDLFFRLNMSGTIVRGGVKKIESNEMACTKVMDKLFIFLFQLYIFCIHSPTQQKKNTNSRGNTYEKSHVFFKVMP